MPTSPTLHITSPLLSLLALCLQLSLTHPLLALSTLCLGTPPMVLPPPAQSQLRRAASPSPQRAPPPLRASPLSPSGLSPTPIPVSQGPKLEPLHNPYTLSDGISRIYMDQTPIIKPLKSAMPVLRGAPVPVRIIKTNTDSGEPMLRKLRPLQDPEAGSLFFIAKECVNSKPLRKCGNKQIQAVNTAHAAINVGVVDLMNSTTVQRITITESRLPQAVRNNASLW